MIEEDEDYRLNEEELTDLVGAASLFLTGLRFPPEKRKTMKRLWYQALHNFTANVMQELEVEGCPDDMERCRDGACMPIGGC